MSKPQCVNVHKKKRRRTNSGSGNGASSNSWLVRLSEACAKHKEYHRLQDENDDDEDDDTTNNNNNNNKMGGISEKCRKDLSTLRKILPEVEKKYTISLLNLVSAQDISHMCAFYRIVVMGGFCQHSMCLLRDSKNNTTEQQSK